MANPVVNTTNTAGSPFWNVQASDLLATGLSALTTLSTAKTAKALAQAQESNPPSSTLDSAKTAWLGNTNLASVAAVVGGIFILFAGGAYVYKKVF